MTSISTNDAPFHTSVEWMENKPAVHVLLNEELQRMWKDVFDQSSVILASASDASAHKQSEARRWPHGQDMPEATKGSSTAGLPIIHGDTPEEARTKDGGIGPAWAEDVARTTSNASRAAQGRATADNQSDGRLNAAGAAMRLGVQSPAVRPLSVPVSSASAAISTWASPLMSTTVAETSLERGMVSASIGGTLPMLDADIACAAALAPESAKTSAHEVQDQHQAIAVQNSVHSERLIDEVVQVFHNDGVIAIVIRDLGLAADVAVRCALETARQLAGDARALRQVTLNGRSIFNGGGRGGGSSAGDRALVSFTC